jgi:hypothetical protein
VRYLVTRAICPKDGDCPKEPYYTKCKNHFFCLVTDLVGLIVVVPLDLVLSAIWEGLEVDLVGLFAAL